MRGVALLLAGLALAGCGGLELGALGSADEATEPTGTAPAATAPDPAAGTPLPLPKPQGAAPEGDGAAAAPAPPAEGAAAAAPHVYMSVQPDRGGPVSVVFAIDRSRDNTPSDEPAVRITPEQTDPDRGRCNPQQLRYFNFPAESATAPVYGPDQASQGVGARDLPGFMATAVSQEMIERGIADDLEATRPQNVCTRKLFEQTIIAANTGQG